MSDHVGAPVAARPLPAFELPYYVVVFSSVRTPGDRGYGETADRMDELVAQMPGYLGHESARTPGGLGITVSYFRDVAAIERWRSVGEHRAAQQQGRAEWYEQYTVHIAEVERSHGFARD
ncbi:antibiotic biosynthesis monooxygenase [Streptomyces sp. SID14478]|uniref:antibiotic biosynthesis monooxygenase family protein n=1 Tax=Streptomyces sp. SID14478 TaxID=2706073 RepID=UPI0013D9CE45|nr:antibiotic biosynthesis monooxygenase [Streptomyces sp. SID14478]NEB73824.1 antibiotic biosynthesis monooxygenase [Streptomyces sp. SID14478]